MPHNEGTVLMEQLSLERFGEIITSHILCGTVNDPKVALINLVVDEEETNVQGSRALARTRFSLLS